MPRNKIIGAADAVEVVMSGDTVVTGGFVGIGFPEHLVKALEQRFLATGEPADVLPPGRSTFFAMIENNERYVLSRTQYSTNAFFRRRLGRQFTEAQLKHRLYRSFADARAGLETGDPGRGEDAGHPAGRTTPAFEMSVERDGHDEPRHVLREPEGQR